MSLLDSIPSDPASDRWIGVDVGGSGARACFVGAAAGLVPIGDPISIEWAPESWSPLPLAEQLADPPPPIESDELAAGERRVVQLAEMIASLGAGPETSVALAVPGLWTTDGRGIAVWRNGPRIPGLLDGLEERTGMNRLFLESDGPAGALGGLLGRDGALRGIESGWYLAGGSGLAEAAIVGGEVVRLGGELRKAWQLSDVSGRCFEDLLAPARINAEWVRRARADAAGRPEQRAGEGDPLALEFMAEIGTRLSRYVELRRADYRRVFGVELELVGVGQSSCALLGGLELPSIVRLSRLRLAPALGAVAAAIGGASDA